MTSIERKESRYRRRCEERARKKQARAKRSDDFDKVFSYAHLYKSYRKCRCGVSWKASVQRYIATAPAQLSITHERLMKGTYRSPGFFEFDLFERGKPRHIRSTVIGERVVQRCLCDNALVPMLTRTFIYDNGASMKGKGYHFAIKRITKHLSDHYRRHGREGYVLLFDFSKFFDNVSHALLERIADRTFTDTRIKALLKHFVDAFGEVGIGLGSQISQVLALSSANRLDHYIKEVLRIREYGRYNDDGYLIHRSKAFLKKCLTAIERICEELKIKLNRKKTQIVALRHGFTWLKCRFFITETGKIIKKMCKASIVRMRRKLKAFHRKLLAGLMTFDDIRRSFICWDVSYAKAFRSWHTRQNARKLFDYLFIYCWRRETANVY